MGLNICLFYYIYLQINIYLFIHFHSNILHLFEEKVTFLLGSQLKGSVEQKHRSLEMFYKTALLNNKFIYRNAGIFLDYSFKVIIVYSALALSWKYIFLMC